MNGSLKMVWYQSQKQTTFVTRSEKTGLITHVISFDFHYKHKGTYLIISHTLQATIQWSAFPGYFSKAWRWSVRVVRDGNGVLASLEMTVSGFTSL